MTIEALATEVAELVRSFSGVRASKRQIQFTADGKRIWSKRSHARAIAYDQHVARVAEQNRRSHRHFLKTGHKPPRKLRLKWATEIARDFA